MSYIVATDLKLQFGGRVLLDGANVSVNEQDRIGLVGPNGSGKSTLLKILRGDITPDSGAITYAKRLRLGYLPQDITELPGDTLLNSVLGSVPGRAEIEARLADVEAELEAAPDVEEQVALAQTLADLHEELAHFEQQFSPHEAMRILKGLGFKEADYERPVAEFSGGWKMRAALAGILFQQPDVLLLDEPTNHLDVPSVQWLDEFLQEYHHAFVLICHDRAFMNDQVNRIVSFEVEGLRTYPGTYDQYVTLREEEERVLVARAKNQVRQRKQMEQYIARFRVSARRSSQAQSRLKALEKMEVIDVRQHRKTLTFKFPPVQRTGEVVITADGLLKAFGAHVLYDKLDLHVMRGDRIGIIGVNGAGKTTLLRLLAKEMEPDGGSVEWGHNVALGYYAQHHAEILSPSNTALGEVLHAERDVSEQMARNVLGLFLFSGDDVEKTVSILSGGEKARVALARLFVQSNNVLLMDEPTNHLDLDSSEALAHALQTFSGTLVFVSHNRSFVNALATKIWDISDGVLTEYPGNLDEYLVRQARRRKQAESRAAPARAVAPEPASAGKARPKSAKRRKTEAARPDVKQYQDQLRRLKRELAELEGRIAQLERKQGEREARLGKEEIYDNQVLFQSLLKEFDEDRQTLERLLARWEHKQAELDDVEHALSAADA